MFNRANGMINVTKVKGQPGSWINPQATSSSGSGSTTTSSTSTPKVGESYKLAKDTPGYYTSADAKAGKNARVNVKAGDYYVFNVSSGMINVTKTKGQPGSWIDPAKVATSSGTTNTTASNQLVVGGSYQLAKSTPGYYTAADAKAKRSARVTVLAGSYYIFNLSNGMINVTKVKGKPGSWINPN